MKDRSHLIWLDLEMTGLDPQRHAILQIGSVVTNNELQIVAEGPCLVIRQSPKIMSAMDGWSARQHKKSGLLDQVNLSRCTLKNAERETLAFLRQHCYARESPLCGNSIGQDRRFLYKYMPELSEFFHYRNIDVSTIKELVKRWYPSNFQAPPKQNTHHVMVDIRESIEELRHYRDMIFKKPTASTNFC